MKRRQHRFNTFPDLDTFIDVTILLSTIYGIPFFLGYQGCKLFFDGTPEECKAWGSIIMIGTPIVCYFIDRILYLFGITKD